MNNDFNREWLTSKFEEIQRRILKVIEQMNDEQHNWRPNHASHSVSTLIRHIEGNIKERVCNGILHGNITRNREEEFKHTYVSKIELERKVNDNFQLVIDTVRTMSDQDFKNTQLVRNRERTNLDILHQCAAHYSEHMGQILYISKLCLKESYISTSI